MKNSITSTTYLKNIKDKIPSVKNLLHEIKISELNIVEYNNTF